MPIVVRIADTAEALGRRASGDVSGISRLPHATFLSLRMHGHGLVQVILNRLILTDEVTAGREMFRQIVRHFREVLGICRTFLIEALRQTVHLLRRIAVRRR